MDEQVEEVSSQSDGVLLAFESVPVPPSGRKLPESVWHLSSHRLGDASWRGFHLYPTLLTSDEKDPPKIPRKSGGLPLLGFHGA